MTTFGSAAMLTMTSGYSSAETSAPAGTRAPDEARVRQNANPYSLDSVLRILHSLILAERGGFLLHAASAICDGRAYLFSGVSGAGKTTMTRLAPADITLLTDEISYLRPSAGRVRGLRHAFCRRAGQGR